MRALRSICILMWVTMASACWSYMRPVVPGAVALKPFRVYQDWWSLAELCTQHLGELKRYRWYYVPGWNFYAPDDTGKVFPLLGLHYGARHEIYLSEQQVMARRTVEHEMIHALGIHGHPPEIFVAQCQVEDSITIKFQTP